MVVSTQLSRAGLIGTLLTQLALSAGAEPTVLPTQQGAHFTGDKDGSYPRGADKEIPLAASTREQLESVMGVEVQTLVEENVGRIIDLLADRSGKVQAAVIEFGGFLGIGTRKITVDWSILRFEVAGKRTIAIVAMTRDQLRAAPEYKPDELTMVRRVAD
jgi:hypothetical protein